MGSRRWGSGEQDEWEAGQRDAERKMVIGSRTDSKKRRMGRRS